MLAQHTYDEDTLIMELVESPEQFRPLKPIDLTEPLSPKEFVDAHTILYCTGYSASPRVIEAFAFYHRRELRYLVGHPAVDSEMMLEELFGHLPARINAGMLEDLVEQVDVLQNKLDQQTTPLQVSKPIAKSTSIPQQEALFDSESGIITRPPSEELVSRAEAVHRFNNTFPKLGGFLIRAAASRKSKLARRALIVPAIIEFIAELPYLIPLGVGVGNTLRRRFIQAAVEEYPHLGHELTNLRGASAPVDKYVKLILNDPADDH